MLSLVLTDCLSDKHRSALAALHFQALRTNNTLQRLVLTNTACTYVRCRRIPLCDAAARIPVALLLSIWWLSTKIYISAPHPPILAVPVDRLSSVSEGRIHYHAYLNLDCCFTSVLLQGTRSAASFRHARQFAFHVQHSHFDSRQQSGEFTLRCLRRSAYQQLALVCNREAR